MRVRCRRTTDVSCCARRDPNRLMTASGTTVWTGRALQAESDDLEVIGLALLYPALERNVCVPGHHGYPRASDLILGKAQRGRSCHQITDATARPFLHLFISARRPRRESQLLLSGSASDVGGGGHPLSRRGLRYARLIAALLCQHGPSDPRQLVGEGSGQNVRMQALSGANEPESEAVLQSIWFRPRSLARRTCRA